MSIPSFPYFFLVQKSSLCEKNIMVISQRLDLFFQNKNIIYKKYTTQTLAVLWFTLIFYRFEQLSNVLINRVHQPTPQISLNRCYKSIDDDSSDQSAISIGPNS